MMDIMMMEGRKEEGYIFSRRKGCVQISKQKSHDETV
jgi:hypothetical protein